MKWIVSYLTDRCQTINIQGKLSVPMPLIYGVPQGSVLSPLLFILYTTLLSKIVTNHKDLQHHLYTNDTQVYTSFKTTSNFSTSLNNLQQCLFSVPDWMFTNKFKLNPDKTEFVLIRNKCHQKKINSWLPFEILSNSINPASHARNLGVTYDADFNFQLHINNTFDDVYYIPGCFWGYTGYCDIRSTSACKGNFISLCRLSLFSGDLVLPLMPD